MNSTGAVRRWYAEEGWGVLDSPDTPGGCFAHFSDIVDVDGYRELTEGETVELEWEHYPPGQDGYSFRATSVTQARQGS